MCSSGYWSQRITEEDIEYFRALKLERVSDSEGDDSDEISEYFNDSEEGMGEDDWQRVVSSDDESEVERVGAQDFEDEGVGDEVSENSEDDNQS